MPSALLLGSSGLIGKELLRDLLASDVYDSVTIVVRREPGMRHPKLSVVTADIDSIDAVREQLAADHVYLTLGTTRKTTPDPAAYYRIDHDYPLKAATLARQAGAKRAAVVTAVGADSKSRSSYLRTKGELERDLATVGFERLHVFRPSMLLGQRSEKRPLERALMTTFRLINPLFLGSLDRFRGIEAADVARAMVRAMISDTGNAVTVHQWREMRRT